ncbi:SMI1/KNR4 family protein [Streptomyces sp. NPDC019396]|uniref:SMI1/KNR4 family protein n=1 Tax=Streptomyces sp. NPDC019396 TaxID=3154687 RepID=UPI003407D03A
MKIDWRAEYFRLLDGRRHGYRDPEAMRREGFPPERRLTETDLRAAEGELGITFPTEYREHLLRHGNPERGSSGCGAARGAAAGTATPTPTTTC